MAELTLETLAARVEALERQMTEQTAGSGRKKDWRRVVGNSEDNEFTRQMLAEIEAARTAEDEVATEEPAA